MVQEPDNLNPFIGIQGIDYMFWHMNYDFLVGFDSKTLEPRPELATAWEVSPDGKEWTFTIRSDVEWQDGVPVTARDVAFTFNYIVDNKLLNLSTYTNGITRAEVIDDTHVKIYTNAPKANMLRMVVPILPEHIWSKISGKAATTSYQNKPPIIGDGPFQLVEWQKGKFVRLAANPTYWAGKPKVDEVIFELYTNPDTMAQDLKLGTIDGAVDIPPAQFKPLGGEPGLTTSQSTSWNFIELAMNCYDSPNSKGNPVLKDQQFRTAGQLGRRQTEGRRRGLPEVRHARLLARRPVLQVPLGAAGRPGLHLRPRQGQSDPRRGRLQGRRRRRLPRDQGRQEAHAALLRHHRLHAEPDGRQAHRRLAQGRRHQARPPGHRRRHAHQLPVRPTPGTRTRPTGTCSSGTGCRTSTPTSSSTSTRRSRSRAGTTACGPTPQYTKLNAQQIQTIDETKRIPIVQQMQQIFYKGAAYAIIAYPYQLEAYNTDKWQGWVHVPAQAPGGQQGSVIYSYNNIDTYRFVAPKVAAAAEKKPLVNWKWLGIGLGGVIILVLIMFGLTRLFGKARREEE